MVKVSLIAASKRPQLWPSFFESFYGTSVSYEVVFAGPLDIKKVNEPYLLFINTANIKPAQCYEIARRYASGETVVWVADDCEFPNDVIGQAYKYWKSKNDEKLILSIQTKETGYNLPQGALFDMNVHRFFGGQQSSPLMAPLGMMSRAFLDSLGGFDRRYICGQYENDVVMRARSAGGYVEIFGNADCFIDIDHLGKSKQIGESKTDMDFLKRPFAVGYHHDRNILESSWTNGSGMIRQERKDKFEPYSEADLLLKSQSFNKSIWI